MNDSNKTNHENDLKNDNEINNLEKKENNTEPNKNDSNTNDEQTEYTEDNSILIDQSVDETQTNGKNEVPKEISEDEHDEANIKEDNLQNNTNEQQTIDEQKTNGNEDQSKNKILHKDAVKQEDVDGQAIIQTGEGNIEIYNLYNGQKNEIKESINDYPKSVRRKKDEKKFEDITFSLEEYPDRLSRFDFTEFNTDLTQICNEQILFVSCYDKEILDAVVYAFAELEYFDSYEKKIFVFSSSTQEKENFFSELINKGRLNKKKQQLVFIKALDRYAESNLDSIPCETFTIQHLKNQLKQNSTFLIFLVKPQYLKLKFKIDEFSKNHQTWQIPFLDILLQQRYPQNYKNLISKIEKQRIKNIWHNDDEEFYGEIIGLIKNGKLKQLIEKYKTDDNEYNIEEFKKDVKSIHADELFKDADSIKKTVLYVATFFKDLTVHDFNIVVANLLPNESTENIIEYEEVTSKGKLKKRYRKEIKSLLDIWKNEPDHYLSECFLESFVQEGTMRVIDFTYPYLRDDLKKYLDKKNPIFLEHNFSIIKNLGLLFYNSMQVVDNVIDIAIQMALYHQNYHGTDWLIEMTIKLTNALEIEIDEKLDEQQQLNYIFSQAIQGSQLFDFVAQRIVILLREMLKYVHLRDMVKKFLNLLMSSSELHYAVLALVRGLKNVSNFNFFYWAKQLLDRGNYHVSEGTYHLIFLHVYNSGEELFNYLAKIERWLPENDKKFEQFSPSNTVSLRTIYEYCYRITLQEITKDDYGKNPSIYPLFKYSDNKDFAENMQMIINWLFNPNHLYFYEHKEIYYNFLAIIIGEWYMILNGLEADTSTNNKNVFTKSLLNSIANLTKKDKESSKMLIESWNHLVVSILETVSQISIDDRASKKILMQKRKIFKFVRSQYRKLLK